MELNPDHCAYFYFLFFTVLLQFFIRGIQGRKPPPTRLGYCIGENAISISLDGLGDHVISGRFCLSVPVKVLHLHFTVRSRLTVHLDNSLKNIARIKPERL